MERRREGKSHHGDLWAKSEYSHLFFLISHLVIAERFRTKKDHKYFLSQNPRLLSKHFKHREYVII